MIEAISDATDVVWYGKKPTGIKRVIVFSRSDLSPIPFIVGRALAGKKNDAVGVIVSKLNQEEPIQIAEDFFPPGWPLWVVGDILIMFTASWPSLAWFLKNSTSAWLYCYQPTRDACSLARELGAESLTFLTTSHMNAYLGSETPTLKHDDFFVYDVAPTGLNTVLDPGSSVGLDLCSWLFAWVFACLGGEATIVGCGGDYENLLSWDSIMLFKAYFNDDGIVCDEKRLKKTYRDFKKAEGEALDIGESMAKDLLKRMGDNGGPMHG